MNEKEVKEAARLGGSRQSVCSVTGRACKCGPGDKCRAARSAVDPLSNEDVRRLKTLVLRLEVADQDAGYFLDGGLYDRQYPRPEVREVRRLIAAAQKIIEGVLE